jgi:hypothetical protein
VVLDKPFNDTCKEFKALLHFCIVGRATLKNVAPRKQNAICKTRAQYAKRNCAFELLKAHCAATINAKPESFHKNNLKHKEATLLIRYFLVRQILNFERLNPGPPISKRWI